MSADNGRPARRLRSRDWFDDPKRIDQTALYLERFMNYGITPEELRSGKPIIGIAQTGSDLVPCDRHHLQLAHRVRDGIRDAGGGLAWLHTGDTIRVDLNEGRCDMLVSDEEIERRKREDGLPDVPQSRTPWQEIYRAGVGQLDGGGVLEAALKYRGVASETPRHNH